jgi:MoaA/NifB/PqqE/SkfB family radical SAM enzyme
MNTLWRITVDTNPEDCNLHCIMCEEHSEYSTFKQKLFEKTGIRHRRMPIDWIEKIFEQAKELGVKEIIPSTMGEPLLYQGIEIFFNLAKKYNIRINLTTNGTFAGKTALEWAKIIVPVTSDTKFSVNGATKQTAENIMRGLNFDKQIENIKDFIAFRDDYYHQTGFYSRVSFQLTFMRNNMHELPDIVKLAADLGVDRIKGHHLWTHFPEIEKLSFKCCKEAINEWNEIVDKTYKAVEKYRRSDGSKILLEQINYLSQDEDKEVPEDYECPFLGRELWISATGKITPCCAPDDLRSQLGYFGHFPETSLKDVLNSKAYQNLVKNYKQYPVCKNCVMRKPVKK